MAGDARRPTTRTLGITAALVHRNIPLLTQRAGWQPGAPKGSGSRMHELHACSKVPDEVCSLRRPSAGLDGTGRCADAFRHARRSALMCHKSGHRRAGLPQRRLAHRARRVRLRRPVPRFTLLTKPAMKPESLGEPPGWKEAINALTMYYGDRITLH